MSLRFRFNDYRRELRQHPALALLGCSLIGGAAFVGLSEAIVPAPGMTSLVGIHIAAAPPKAAESFAEVTTDLNVMAGAFAIAGIGALAAPPRATEGRQTSARVKSGTI